MSKLTNDAYELLDDMAGFIDTTMHGDHPRRAEIEAWLIAYEKGDDTEVLDRVRRIETRLCVLMEHLGIRPQSDGTFLTPAR